MSDSIRYRVLGVAFALLAAVLAGYFWNLTRSGVPAPPPPEPAQELHSGLVAAPAPRSSESRIDAAQGEAPARRPASIGPIVRGANREPIRGAAVSWTLIVPFDRESAAAWTWDQGLQVQSRTRSAVTGESGAIELDPPAGTAGAPSVIWVTHPDHASWCMVLSPGEGVDLLPAHIDLQAAPGIDVLILDQEGRPVEGALVGQRLELGFVNRPGSSIEDLSRLACLWRTALTGSGGRARMADLPGRQTIDASARGLSTPPWTGTAPDRVTLRLMPTFTLIGLVESEDSTIDLSRSRIDVGVRRASRKWAVSCAPVERSGSFGPLRVPIAEGEEYCFDLQAGAVVPHEVRRPIPAAGSVLEVRVPARRGVRFPVRVIARDERPIPGVEVGWAWSVGVDWQWTFVGSDAEGVAVLPAAPPGDIWLQLSKTGFVRSKQLLSLWNDVSPPYEVKLDQGGVLRGRVTAAGEPVRDFALAYHAAGSSDQDTVVEVRDAKDGSYEVDGMPLGDQAVLVYSLDHPRTPTRVVRIAPDVPAAADFQLSESGPVRGRVISAETSDPISDAAIRLYAAGDNARLRSWGWLSRTSTDGSFEVSGAAPGVSGFIEITADGLAPALHRYLGAAAGATDVGTIALAPALSVSAYLVIDPGIDPAPFTASLAGPANAPNRSFDSSGSAVFSGLSRGVYEVTVARGLDWWVSLPVQLRSAGPRRVRFDLRRVRDLAVEVIPEFGASLPTGCTLRILYDAEGEQHAYAWHWPIDSSSRMDIGYLPARRMRIQILDPEAKLIGSLIVSDADQAVPLIRIPVGGVQRRVRVIDARGDPIGIAGITIGVGEPAEWLLTGSTDTRGEYPFELDGHDRVDMCISRLGLDHGVLRAVVLKPGITEVVYEPGAEGTFVLRDGAQPLEGVAVDLYDAGTGELWLESLSTDAQGRAASQRMTPGPVAVVVEQPGLWPVRRVVAVTEPPREHEVQVRRRGSATLRFTRGGLAVTGLAVRVASREFQQDVAEWLVPGFAVANPSDLRTDAAGRLRLDGLPNGVFAWSVDTEAGPRSGEFQVEPGLAVLHDLALD